MPLTVEEVPAWLILDGIGHVLVSSESHWHYTLCGTMTPNGAMQADELPRRKCRRCVAKLKTARVKEGANLGALREQARRCAEEQTRG